MAFSKTKLLAGIGAVLLLAASNTSAAARGGITLYQEDNFRGDSRTLDDDVPNLHDIRFDDRVSSVVVRHGVWQLCEDSWYRGRCITLDDNVAKLSRMHFDDRISSVRRIR
jgi:hypothetical protein